jgi:hypothetical protein
VTTSQHRVFLLLLVVLVGVFALILAAPISQRELRSVTPATAPQSTPVLAHIEETP